MIKTNLIHYPKRTVLIKPVKQADNYWDYSLEAGCDAWDNLKAIDNAINEPMGLWIPEKDSIKYVFGIEVSEPVSIEGYELIELEESDYLEFKSEPYNDENYHRSV